MSKIIDKVFEGFANEIGDDPYCYGYHKSLRSFPVKTEISVDHREREIIVPIDDEHPENDIFEVDEDLLDHMKIGKKYRLTIKLEEIDE